MIEDFYGLSDAPFRLAPDPRFFYASDTHGKALLYLKYGLRQGEGFVALTGDVGAGKSTLIAHLLDEIDRRRLTVGQLSTTNLEPADALWMIANSFGLHPVDRGKGASLHALEIFLQQEHTAGRHVLLIIDEAQNLPIATLEELRMLTNVSFGGHYPLQCFLVGQTQLRHALVAHELEQLRQRIIASYHLEPLSPEETRRYIEHRLQTAGWQGRPSFAPELFEQVYAATSGIPRRINMLLGRLLLFGALDQLDHLDRNAIASVIADLESEVVGLRARPAPNGSTATPSAAPDVAPIVRVLQDRIEELEDAIIDVVQIVDALLANRLIEAEEQRSDIASD
jgi:general secretion pathway protein A